MVFALFALQVYVGVLRQKCVLDIDSSVVVTDASFMEYVQKRKWATKNYISVYMCVSFKLFKLNSQRICTLSIKIYHPYTYHIDRLPMAEQVGCGTPCL